MHFGLNRWTITPQPRQGAALQLLCFHHAGGGAYSYRPWPQRLRPEVELIAVQLPGRENRHAEPLLHHAEAVLDGLIGALQGALGRRYAMFGHSLGAMLAYSLACRVRRTGELAAPVHLFLSAARPPKLAAVDEAPFEPPAEQDAIRQLRRLGGTPEAVFEDPGLLRAFLPALLADYEILSRLRRRDEPPLDIPLTLFKGDDDRTIRARHLEEWRRLSSAPSQAHSLPGGHFYPPASQASLLDTINAVMGGYV
ncbi:MAG: alpha/beta fold hydrolase [Phenylobacterium sp.]